MQATIHVDDKLAALLQLAAAKKHAVDVGALRPVPAPALLRCHQLL